MSNSTTGGAAFPIRDGNHATMGMTLRDYFAAKAMQGLLSNGWCSDLRNDHYGENAGNRTVATDAYMMADAMMKAREA
jgi:hypothetical protein